MKFELMTDKDILAALGQQYDLMRRHKQIKDKDILESGGLSSRVLAKFRAGENINFDSFIKLMRAIGELEKLENLFEIPEQYSPTGKTTPIPKRIRTGKKQNTTFTWGDDEQ